MSPWINNKKKYLLCDGLLLLSVAAWFWISVTAANPWLQIVLLALLFIDWWALRATLADWTVGGGPGSASADISTGIALLIYFTFISLLVNTYRSYAGFYDIPPFDLVAGALSEEYYRNDGQFSVYNKAGLRLAITDYVSLIITGVVLAEFVRRYFRFRFGKGFKLDPVFAMFIVLLFFGSVWLPPYQIDLPHWATWIGAATEVWHGALPYFHTFSQYGFMPIILLALWLKLFALTPLALASFVMLVTFIAGLLSYLLVQRLTRSRAISFFAAVTLVSGFYTLVDGIGTGNVSALRAQLPIAGGLYLLWASYSKGKNAIVAGFLLGFVVLWEAGFGFFLLVAYLATHLYRLVALKKSQSKSCLFALASSLGLSLVVIYAFFTPQESPFKLIDNIRDVYSAYVSGFGALAQKTYWFELLVVFFYPSCLLMLYRRYRKPVFRLTDRDLFGIATIIISIPWVTYELNRSNEWYAYPLMWAIAPASALYLSCLYRIKSFRHIALAATILIMVQADLVKRVTSEIGAYLVRYEFARHTWSVECADRARQGLKCDDQPTLKQYVKASQKSFLDTDSHLLITTAYEYAAGASDFVLSRACERGIPVFSHLDSYLYAYNHCRPHNRFPTFHTLFTKKHEAEVLKSVGSSPVLIFDDRYYGYKFTFRLHDKLRAHFLASGYSGRKVTEHLEMLYRKDVNPENYLREILSACCIPIHRVMEGGADAVRAASSRLGEWVLQDSKLEQRSVYSPARIFARLPAEALEYNIKTDIHVEQGNFAGIIFDVKNESEYSIAYVNFVDNLLEVFTHTGPAEMDRKPVFSAPVGNSMDKHGWHSLEVAVKRDRVELYLDARLCGQFAYQKIGADAKIGLLTYGTKAAFKDTEVAIVN